MSIRIVAQPSCSLRTALSVRLPTVRRAARPLAPLVRASEGSDPSSSPSPSSTSTAPPPAPSPPAAAIPAETNNNKTIALAGVGVGIALTILSKATVGGGLGGSVGLDQLVRESTPLEVALKSGKPTIIEFYADWCEVCRESASNVYNVQQSVLKGKANLVMLNVENSAWAPEMMQFGVRAIPEYVFVDASNKPQALLIGKVPYEVLEADAKALVAQQ